MADILDRLNAALAGRYRIDREIGAGGMATVYLARDLKHERRVALKVLFASLGATLGAERFHHEIRIAASLTHPHILPLHDSGEADGLLYYVMPYVEGESLRERLGREGRLSVGESIRLADQIASALAYAHERGVVHRDIKPENILITKDQAMLADFGIARAVEVSAGARLTGTGLVMGTPAYMSPEQADGTAEVDGRSDVYALGCVVYEMVAGRAPFEGKTARDFLVKHAAVTAPGLRTVDPAVPLFLDRAVARALAKTPDERFPSATEFAAALTSQRVVARVGGKGSWRRRGLAGAALGVAATAVWWLSTLMGGSGYRRLAVLPLIDLNHDPEQQYFVQGIHDGLISELQRAGVNVIARTSVLQYENAQKPIRQIAGELGVDALVESSLSRSGDSVAMEVRLVNGKTEEYVGAPVTRSSHLRDVDRLYRQLTGAIAREIGATLTPEVEARLAAARSVDPGAYEAYLQGEFHWKKLTREDLELAERYFTLALEKDSSYAPAYEGLAVVWGARQQMQITHPAEAGPKARLAAEHAVKLDDASAGAHEALAMIRTWTDWDWPGADVEWRRALELDPNRATAHAYYAHYLATTGHVGEALPHSQRALEVDPFNPLFHGMYAMVLAQAHRFQEAVASAQKALVLQPNLGMARNVLQHAYVALNMRDEMVEVQRERNAIDPERVAVFEAGLAEGGYEEAFLRLGDLLAARYRASGGTPAAGARVSDASWRGRVFMPLAISHRYIYAGVYEQAIRWIEEAYAIHEPSIPYIAVDPLYDPLRSDPRFQALVQRLHLPHDRREGRG